MEVTTMPFQLHITGLLLLSGLFLLSEPKPLMAPPPPTLVSPANGALMDNGCQPPKQNNVTWDFDWSDVPGATAYHIRVWRNPALPFINDMNVTSSAYHFDKPQGYVSNNNLLGWRWRVRAKVHGAWGPWSIARSFRVEKLNTDCP
jgi:hypothetical protein